MNDNSISMKEKRKIFPTHEKLINSATMLLKEYTATAFVVLFSVASVTGALCYLINSYRFGVINNKDILLWVAGTFCAVIIFPFVLSMIVPLTHVSRKSDWQYVLNDFYVGTHNIVAFYDVSVYESQSLAMYLNDERPENCRVLGMVKQKGFLTAFTEFIFERNVSLRYSRASEPQLVPKLYICDSSGDEKTSIDISKLFTTEYIDDYVVVLTDPLFKINCILGSGAEYKQVIDEINKVLEEIYDENNG